MSATAPDPPPDADPDAAEAIERFRERGGYRKEDPTGTTHIRRQFAADVYRRFRALKGAILQGVARNDAFGLGESPPRPGAFAAQATDEELELMAYASDADINIRPPNPGEYAFPSDARQVQAFIEWLSREVNREVLEAELFYPRSVAASDHWVGIHTRRGYAAGVEHADDALVRAGIIPSAARLDDIFNVPMHADNAGLAYVRNYHLLDGVTNDMAQDLREELAKGITRGYNPHKTARNINERIDNVGIHRGRLIARTETIRAYNEAALNRYEETERVAEIAAVSEFLTAGDDRVCEECEALEGATYSVEQARGVIPVHPNCRCTWIPVPSDWSQASRDRGRYHF